MNFGVITFPGSNCDDDMVYVLGEVFGHKVKKIWHKDTQLHGINPGDCLILPGGFSYGDYLRCGAIARFSPIMNEVIKFAHNGGLVIGICNGFQILCEAGLLPGQLLLNQNQLFICQNPKMRASNNNSPLTYDLDLNKIYTIPIAHAEGRYFADQDTLHRISGEGQILFQYCNDMGVIDANSNINGSCLNIAGICNEKRNVCGMMPHPERASEKLLGNDDGRWLFKSLFAWMQEHYALIA